jgi:hypothetical protein
VSLLIYGYAECHYAEYHYAGCHYTECRHAGCRYAECRYVEYYHAECREANIKTSNNHLRVIIWNFLSSWVRIHNSLFFP